MLSREILEFPQAKREELAKLLGHSLGPSSSEGSCLRNSPRIQVSLDPQKNLSYTASKLITCQNKVIVLKIIIIALKT